MLKLLNDTKYTANLYPGYNKNNEHQLTCVIKAGYNFDSCGNLKLFDIPPQIEIEDNFIGDVNKSSLSSTSDIMPYKYKSEILIYGTAQIDKKKYLSSVKVQIKRENNTWEKSLCIFGVRFWRKVLFWVFPGRPSDLKPTPIIYEYAFGGEGYEKNPAGIGYSEKLFNKKNIPMPQIEEFSKVTENTKNMPSAGFTPIPHYWTLIKKHLPLPNVYSMAPKDQQFDKPFFGNEIISIQGMIEGIDTNEKVDITLPKVKFEMDFIHKNKKRKLKSPICDTLIINTDKKILYTIWRSAIPWEIDDQREALLHIKSKTI